MKAGESYFDEIEAYEESPAALPSHLNGQAGPRDSMTGSRPMSIASARTDYVTATITLPLGDLTAEQTRAAGASSLANINTEHVRTTVEQNIVFRWLPESQIISFLSRT